MEGFTIDEDRILATFDALVAKNVILYGDEQVYRMTENGFDFEFRVCPSFLTKPGMSGATSSSQDSTMPTFGPGSDILDADPDLSISTINNTHRLVLNRYCVFRPQYLILTLDSYRRQTELLDISDLSATWSVLQALQTEHFAIYNRGQKAGCSRLHKHLQVFPVPRDFVLFPDSAEVKAVPYRYYLSRFEEDKHQHGDGQGMVDFLYGEYQRLVSEALTKELESMRFVECYFAHNVVLTKRWLAVIPRREEAVKGAFAGAAGMCGMVWVATSAQYENWIRLGPTRVLSALGSC